MNVAAETRDGTTIRTKVLDEPRDPGYEQFGMCKSNKSRETTNVVGNSGALITPLFMIFYFYKSII